MDQEMVFGREQKFNVKSMMMKFQEGWIIVNCLVCIGKNLSFTLIRDSGDKTWIPLIQEFKIVSEFIQIRY